MNSIMRDLSPRLERRLINYVEQFPDFDLSYMLEIYATACHEAAIHRGNTEEAAYYHNLALSAMDEIEHRFNAKSRLCDCLSETVSDLRS